MKTLILVLFTSCIMYQTNYGCTCFSNPIKKSYNTSSIIFIGQVIDEIEDSREYSERPFVFQVNKNYKNTSQDTIVVSTGYGFGDCGYPFEFGKKYLVYATQYQGEYYTNTCSRTKPIEVAKFDLSFLHNLPNSMETSFVVGDILHWENNGQLPTKIVKVSNKKVTLKNNNFVFTSTTDNDGFYIFENIPLGKYSIEVDFKQGLEFSETEKDSIDINKIDFYINPLTLLLPCTLVVNLSDNVNSTYLYGDTRQSLIPVSNHDRIKQFIGSPGVIKHNGNKIIFDRMPPGKYKFGINTSPFDVSHFHPYPKQYYPNTENISDAEIITLSRDKRNVEIDMYLTRIPTYNIKGKFFTKDSLQIPKIEVTLRASEDDDTSKYIVRGYASKDYFEIGLLENMAGWLHFKIINYGRRNINVNDYKKIEPYQIHKNTNLDNLKIEIKKK